MSKTKTEFETVYDAGYDAGRYGANKFNSHYNYFSTKERMQEWKRGNKGGLLKKEVELNAKNKTNEQDDRR